MTILLTVVVAPVLAFILLIGGAIFFFSPKPPPPLQNMIEKEAVLSAFVSELPPVSRFVARDGARLAYRYYPGGPGGGVATLIHGSSGSSIALHAMAKTFAAEGISVYAPDLRGHGDNGTSGDVAYIGQLEDDLEDLVAVIAAASPGEKRLLGGHSQGGGFTLKVASSPRAKLFDGYIAASPFISARSPMNRPDTGGWANASVPRIVALLAANAFGVTAFNYLPVVAYAVQDRVKSARARFNTFAFFASASFDRDWRAGLKRISQPCFVTIGADDELFVSEAYAPNIAAENPSIHVEVIPKVGHLDSVLAPVALEAYLRAARAILAQK